MSNYLNNLISRSFKQAEAIRPRPSGFFESIPPGDVLDFQHAYGWDASEVLYSHPERAVQSPASVSPKTRPTYTRVSLSPKKSNDSETQETMFPKTMEEPDDPITQKTVLLKRGNPTTNSVVPSLTRVEIENRSSPSITVLRDPVKHKRSVRIFPSDLGSDDLIQEREELNPERDDLIRPTSESTGATAKNIRTGHIKTHKHQGDTRKISTVHFEVEARECRGDVKRVSSLRAEADKISGNTEELPASKRPDNDRGFTDRLGLKTMVVKSHVSPHIEKIGVVSIMPAKSTEEPPSINITIGRIEVKAMKPREPEQPQQKKKPSGIMSLDKYLSNFERGGRG